MKDLILNFSLDKLLSLPPTEFLAVVVLAILGIVVLIPVVMALVAIVQSIVGAE